MKGFVHPNGRQMVQLISMSVVAFRMNLLSTFSPVIPLTQQRPSLRWPGNFPLPPRVPFQYGGASKSFGESSYEDPRAPGYDHFGFGRDGYNAKGYSRSGYSRHGFDDLGRDRFGRDYYGRDRLGQPPPPPRSPPPGWSRRLPPGGRRDSYDEAIRHRTHGGAFGRDGPCPDHPRSGARAGRVPETPGVRQASMASAGSDRRAPFSSVSEGPSTPGATGSSNAGEPKYFIFEKTRGSPKLVTLVAKID